MSPVILLSCLGLFFIRHVDSCDKMSLYINFSATLFDTSASLDTQNRFYSLSSLSDPESPVPDNIGTTAASSPIVQDQNEARAKTAKAVLNHPLRI